MNNQLFWLASRDAKQAANANAPPAFRTSRHLTTSYPLYRFLIDFRFSSQFLRNENNRHVCVAQVLSNLFMFIPHFGDFFFVDNDVTFVFRM